MELNSVLFPAPLVNYTPKDVEGEMLYIPRFFQFKREFTNEVNQNLKAQKAKLGI